MNGLKVFFGATRPPESWLTQILNNLGSEHIWKEQHLKDRVLVKQPKIYYNGPFGCTSSSTFQQLEQSDVLFCYLENYPFEADAELFCLIGYALAKGLSVFIYLDMNQTDAYGDFKAIKDFIFYHPNVEVEGVYSALEAFNSFVDMHTPCITDSQFEFLSSLVKDLSAYIEVLNEKSFMESKNLKVLSYLNKFEAIALIGHLKALKEELAPYLKGIRSGAELGVRHQTWLENLTEEEIKVLFSAKNKVRLETLIQSLTQHFKANIKELDVMKDYMKACLAEKEK